MARTAVFDLDGTLLAGDSTVAWLRMLLSASWPRWIAIAIALPACLFLIWIRSSRRVGASILLWLATVGYSEEAIMDSMVVFVRRFEQGDCAIRWHSDGLATMQHHLAGDERVVVVTAAPQWLAAQLLAPWTEVRVLGSTLARRWGGWVFEEHCFGQEKCRALQDNGYGSAWNFAYTDSSNDAPLLAGATERGFIVNARRGLVARLTSQTRSRISSLRWI